MVGGIHRLLIGGLLTVHAEYEAEAFGDGLSSNSISAEQNPMNSRHLPAPVPRHPNSQRPSVYEYQSEVGDYFRDTNAVQDPLRGPTSRPSSRAVSDYNRATVNLRQSTFRSPSQERLTMGAPINPFGTLGSAYGGAPPPPDPRMTVNSAVMNRSMSPALSLGGRPQPTLNAARPISTFSMATTFFTGPSNNSNPSDDELYEALRTYLSTQDLMTVTKKYACFFLRPQSIADHICRTAREAMAARYPRADLTLRKDFLNQSIDNILSHS